MKCKKLLALLTAFILAVSLAACGKEPEPVEPSSESESSASESESSAPLFINTLSESGVNSKIPKKASMVREYYEMNADTVGWLTVPGTHIDDVVVCYTAPGDNNNYYYRRDFEKNYSFNGIFYADFRSKFGEHTSKDLPNNTVIYGHTMSADWDGVMFAPLKYFTDEEFARETPYVYYSTGKEDLAFEVFAVFYATVDLPYNVPGLPDSEFTEVVGECIKRSMYNYDTQVTASDKIITMSTCTYSVPGIGNVKYPNNYRYVVMGKLVSKKDAVKTEASFTVNPSPKAP